MGLLDLALKTFRADDNKVVGVGGRANKMFKILFRAKNLKNKKFKNGTYIKAVEKLFFLIFDAKKAFNHFWQAFIKASILQYFDLKSYI